MIFLLGEDVKVAAAKNPLMIGFKGRVAIETMHTITLASAQRKVILPKAGTVLELASGKVVLGDELEGRLEDRILGGRKR
jgi:RNase P/RNase MRP subunit p29